MVPVPMQFYGLMDLAGQAIDKQVMNVDGPFSCFGYSYNVICTILLVFLLEVDNSDLGIRNKVSALLSKELLQDTIISMDEYMLV
eukprot:6445489-Ditylum_brightwellii.AAC.1